MPRKIRLMLIDDHIVVRMGLAFMINSQPDMVVVGEAGNGAEGLQVFRETGPDVVLMDLRLPDITGIECTRELREFDGEAKIVVLTTFGGDENVFRALQAGAKAYLLKDMGREDILGTIRAVDAGQSWLPPAIAASLARRIPEAELSKREVEILGLIALGNSNKEIGARIGISESTVKGHVNHILSKLKAKDRTEAVTLALRRGFITLE